MAELLADILWFDIGVSGLQFHSTHTYIDVWKRPSIWWVANSHCSHYAFWIAPAMPKL
jgi:hypothetical protein